MHTLRSQNTPIWPAAIRLSSGQAHQCVAGDKYDEHLQNHHFGWWWRWKWWWWVGGGGWRSRTTGRGKTSNAACWSFPWKHDEMGRMMITTFFLSILGSHIVLFFLIEVQTEMHTRKKLHVYFQMKLYTRFLQQKFQRCNSPFTSNYKVKRTVSLVICLSLCQNYAIK